VSKTLKEKYCVVYILSSLFRYLQLLIVVVSQFTLLANTKKGSKPDFHGAAGGEQAKALYQLFVEKVKQGYKTDRVKDGVFQAMSESK
jgi:D-tyrosyl-tRNA(Tyr) deacylase